MSTTSPNHTLYDFVIVFSGATSINYHNMVVIEETPSILVLRDEEGGTIEIFKSHICQLARIRSTTSNLIAMNPKSNKIFSN
jgi:hypothetical protein